MVVRGPDMGGKTGPHLFRRFRCHKLVPAQVEEEVDDREEILQKGGSYRREAVERSPEYPVPRPFLPTPQGYYWRSRGMGSMRWADRLNGFLPDPGRIPRRLIKKVPEEREGP